MTRRSRFLLALVAALAAAAPAPSFDAASGATRWSRAAAASVGLEPPPQPSGGPRSGAHPADPAGSNGQEPAPRQPAALDAALLDGLRFRTIGPATMSGRIVDIAVVESDPFVFYVASATGGVWKTTDNGVTWTPVFQHEAVHSVGAIAVHQADPDIVWVGSGEAANRQSVGWGDGVYKSTDAGRTWKNMGLRDTKHIARIALHPRDTSIVFVAATGHLWGPNRERGLFKSSDGGATWRQVLFVDEDTGVTDVAIDPSDPAIMYAASYQRRRSAFGFHGGGPGSALWKSTDGGETWRKLTRGLPEGDKGRIGISIYRKDPRIVYACIEQGRRYNASTAYEQRLAGIYRSEDRGESWTHMSDWNPRPMYASQIRVDPNDDRRIYMVNSFSYSDDGGKTFTVPRQSLHGDDRVVWIDPRDSRHLIKGDDGGVGISYDRGLKWLYVTSLPVSQFYRIDVDMRKPYWVYGGLQDNGSWAGPSATYFTSGVLNDDWVRTGGGDGFVSRIDRTDNRTLYVNSQYLGLSRFDMVTHERQDIRPDQPRGFIVARRNWTTWGRPGAPEPELGNAMAPANWDAAFIISPHDPRTLYAGMRELWKSTDRGLTWTSLGDMTTGVDRSTLALMGQKPGETTLSLDDGVPYYPGVTAIAESPRRQGLLYVGTDDGNLNVSEDGGRTWTNVAGRLPGLPPSSWFAGIEASSHDENVVYVTVDNHRSDDYRNYVYRSADRGRTWTSIVGDLPPDRVARTIREDPRNPRVLYLGTEFGLFVTIDGGSRWVELKGNMPRVAVNDLVIHPRDNDLVVATHSRGVWILDSLSALQELAPEATGGGAQLFTIRPAEMIRYSSPKAHMGDMVFRGENPPAGAIIDYYLPNPASKVALSVHDRAGNLVQSLTPGTRRGVNRVVWNLRHAPLPAPEPGGGEEEGGPSRPEPVPGPFVVPGQYVVRLLVDGRTHEQTVQVSNGPRLQVPATDRQRWTETLLEIGGLYRQAAALAQTAKARAEAAPAGDTAAREELRVARELQSRLLRLYRAVSGVTGPLTADQRSQLEYFRSFVTLIDTRLKKAA
jgi:photosystem II stability/assembly factor-like uncharacterized protein